MVKADRSNNNIYYFMKKHPELKLEMSPSGNVYNVVFPENCNSITLFIIHGRVEYLQFSTFDSPELFTYDITKDPCYDANLAKLMKE